MAGIERTASAVWNGTLREGAGRASVGSGIVQDVPITFVSRFEHGPGTNPEELIGAAHAACFSMALSAGLTRAETPPDEIRTTATVTLTMGEGGARVNKVHLDTVGRVPGIDADAFEKAALDAKDNCPISRLLRPGLESLTVAARLEG
jgi:osmotically inducible protein OsmC